MMASCSHSLRHGNQGILDTASKSVLENEFGTSKDDEVVAQIIEKGSINESEVSPASQGSCGDYRDSE